VVIGVDSVEERSMMSRLGVGLSLWNPGVEKEGRAPVVFLRTV
jgi:hypothetical protein